jgi:cytidylate kinase
MLTIRKNGFVIAIDGPAGSGKSTVSRIVAEKLNYLYIDTGAMYRALTWKALREKLDLTDEKSLVKLAKITSIKLTQANPCSSRGSDYQATGTSTHIHNGGVGIAQPTHAGAEFIRPLNAGAKLTQSQRAGAGFTQPLRAGARLMPREKVFVDDIDVTTEIRNPEVTKNVSYIADVPEIRECMVALQRQMGKEGGVVLEGRDIGTIVFPDADRKIYLDAGIEERAGRRYKELNEKGYKAKFAEVEEKLRLRDKQDKGRKVAPLRAADGAVIIDTTHMNIDEAVKEILKLVPTLPAHTASGGRREAGGYE